MIGPEIADRCIVDLIANFIAPILANILVVAAILDPFRPIGGQLPIGNAGSFSYARTFADTGPLANSRARAIRRQGTWACAGVA
jgi:hypothetical protein